MNLPSSSSSSSVPKYQLAPVPLPPQEFDYKQLEYKATKINISSTAHKNVLYTEPKSMDAEDKRMRSVSSSFKTLDIESIRSVGKFHRTMTHKKIQPPVSSFRSDTRSLPKKVTCSGKPTESGSIDPMMQNHSRITEASRRHMDSKGTNFKKQQNPPILRSVSDSSCGKYSVRTQPQSDVSKNSSSSSSARPLLKKSSSMIEARSKKYEEYRKLIKRGQASKYMIDALKNLKKEEEWEKEKESYPKRRRNMERITKKECKTIDNRIRVGPFPQGSVDVQNIADETGIHYEKANRRIKKDERSKLPRAPGQKLQQRKKITKDQQNQLENDYMFHNPDWSSTVGREEYRLANCPDIRRDQIVNFMRR
ncbi:hypothetical protein B9Z55_018590 [Caenorhabditis nigoni]|nr:hypothetical protein B9Z55_018590 [Caenorhabditis nigoni]